MITIDALLTLENFDPISNNLNLPSPLPPIVGFITRISPIFKPPKSTSDLSMMTLSSSNTDRHIVCVLRHDALINHPKLIPNSTAEEEVIISKCKLQEWKTSSSSPSSTSSSSSPRYVFLIEDADSVRIRSRPNNSFFTIPPPSSHLTNLTVLAVSPAVSPKANIIKVRLYPPSPTSPTTLLFLHYALISPETISAITENSILNIQNAHPIGDNVGYGLCCKSSLQIVSSPPLPHIPLLPDFKITTSMKRSYHEMAWQLSVMEVS